MPLVAARAAPLMTARAAWESSRIVITELLVALALLPLAAAALDSLGSPGSPWAHWWGSSRGWESIGHTLALAAGAATVATALAWLLVAAAARLSRRAAVLVAVASCLPLLVPSSLLGTAWIVALGRDGLLTGPLRTFIGESFDLYSPPAAAVALALRYFGLAALVLTWERLRQERSWPAERVFNLPRLAIVRRLRLRAGLGPTLAAWLLVLLFCANDHILPGMLLVSTYGTQVLIRYSALLDPAGAAALALPMAAAGLVMVLLALAASRAAWTSGEPAASVVPRPRSRAARVAGAAVALLILMAALAAPVGVLAWQAGSPAALAEAMALARDQVTQTLYLSAVAGLICAAAAAFLADHWLRSRRQGWLTAAPLVLINLTVPPSLLGIGLASLAQRWPLSLAADSSALLIWGCAARFLPVATLLLYTLWRSESQLEVQAARVHGVSPWRRLHRILWPQRRLGLLMAGALCGLLVATELEISILLAPPGASTLGVRLYTLIHTAPDQVVSALALDLLLLVGPGLAVLVGLIFSYDKLRERG